MIETVSKDKPGRKILTPTQTIPFFHFLFFGKEERKKKNTNNLTKVHSLNPEQLLCSQDTFLTLNLSWWKTAHCHIDSRWQSCHMECIWRFSSSWGSGLGLACIAPRYLQGQAGRVVMQNQVVGLQSPGTYGSASPQEKSLAVEITCW